MKRLLYTVLLLFIIINVLDAKNIIPDETFVYKQTEEGDLTLSVFYPKGKKLVEEKRSVIIHFFGGGWVGGTQTQFYQQCVFLATQGYVAISADYRVMKSKEITPFDCVEDARSAIRFVREHAQQLGVDPKKVIASGGSAGGHLALCTAVFKPVIPENQSSIPNALILYNPVLDTTLDGYGTDKFQGNELLLSPNQHIHEGLPPTLIFHGTADKTVPFANAEKFAALMKTYGNDCQLVPFKDADHGFFNGSYFRKGNNDVAFNRCMEKVILFLKKYNFANKKTLSSDNYHCLRDSLMNSAIQFRTQKKGRVAFVGGSITYNEGWRNEVCTYLQNEFSETSFDFITAGVPSQGSVSAAFRLDRDVLSKGKIDLIFVEAAVNDRTPALRCNRTDRIRGMEGVIRHIRRTNPKADIIMMHFVDQHKIADYRMDMMPQEITDHERVAEHYQVSSIHLAKEVTERIENDEFNWKDDFQNLHPSPFGQTVYAHSIKRFLDRNYKNIKTEGKLLQDRNLPQPLDSFCYDSGQFISIKEANNLNGFAIGYFLNSGNKDKTLYLQADQLKSSFTFSFKGNAVGVVILSGPDAGMIEYQVDDQPVKVFDLYTTNSWVGYIPRYYVLEDGLENKQHTINIKVIKRSNPYSKGDKCLIKEFIVN